MKHGPLYDFFKAEHRRLESLLNQATTTSGEIQEEVYAKFLSEMSRHISLEEKILLPEVLKTRLAKHFTLAAVVRWDHQAIELSLGKPPSPQVIAALRTILTTHNQKEEMAGGLFEVCEQVLGDKVQSILGRI